MTGGSIVKNLAMICLGMMAGMIGIDQMTGYFRFSYGVTALGDGLGIVPVAVGLFGISEILVTAGSRDIREVLKPHFRDLLPSIQELRGFHRPDRPRNGSGVYDRDHSGIGAYHLDLRLLRLGAEDFQASGALRAGCDRGVAGPESANNAASEGALVPLLALGVPTGPVPAILLAALMVHGITPGPLFIQEQPQVFGA